MPDLDQQSPLDEPAESWLAQNRKIAILGGLVIVLVAATVVSLFVLRQPATTNTRAIVNTTTAVNAPTNTYNRPTFQRSTVAEPSTNRPPTYQPPTSQDLRRAIDQLTNTPTL